MERKNHTPDTVVPQTHEVRDNEHRSEILSKINKMFGGLSHPDIRQSMEAYKVELPQADVVAPNVIDQYSGIVDSYRLLKPEEERELLQVLDDGITNFETNSSEESLAVACAFNILVATNLRLVLYCVSRYITKYGDFGSLNRIDLVQEGNIGLMEALVRFDTSKKVKLSTYATHWIDQHLQRAVENQARIIRMPSHAVWNYQKLRKLSAQHNTNNPEILAAQSGLEIEKVKLLLERGEILIASLDRVVNEDGRGTPVLDLVMSSESPGVPVIDMDPSDNRAEDWLYENMITHGFKEHEIMVIGLYHGIWFGDLLDTPTNTNPDSVIYSSVIKPNGLTIAEIARLIKRSKDHVERCISKFNHHEALRDSLKEQLAA